MNSSLQVRLISSADASSYYALRARSVGGLVHAAETEVLRELGGGVDGLARLLAQYGDEGIRVWGVFNRKMLVGAIGLSPTPLAGHTCIALLWGVFVLPQYRGTPVSRLLMEPVIECCEREWHVDSISVGFARSNFHARRFFERFGFEALISHSKMSQAVIGECDKIHMRRPV